MAFSDEPWVDDDFEVRRSWVETARRIQPKQARFLWADTRFGATLVKKALAEREDSWLTEEQTREMFELFPISMITKGGFVVPEGMWHKVEGSEQVALALLRRADVSVEVFERLESHQSLNVRDEVFKRHGCKNVESVMNALRRESEDVLLCWLKRLSLKMKQHTFENAKEYISNKAAFHLLKRWSESRVELVQDET